MTEKVLGYILLGAGVFTLLFAAFNIYQVFTKQIRPVQVFNLKGISLDTSKIMENSLPPEFAGLMQSNKPSSQEIIPAQMLNDSSNLFAHLLFMGFIASIGVKLATIGTQLIRPIVVKLRTTETTENK